MARPLIFLFLFLKSVVAIGDTVFTGVNNEDKAPTEKVYIKNTLNVKSSQSAKVYYTYINRK